MDNKIKERKAYEANQIKEIVEWKNEPPSVASQALGFVMRPLNWVAEQVIPERAIKGALEGASWLADQTIDLSTVLAEAEVGDTEELRGQPLCKLDDLADGVHNWAIGYAVAEGGLTGAGGLFTIAIDVPFIVTLAVRTIRKIGMCYGYVDTSDFEQNFAMSVLSAAGANSIEEKTAALLTLRTIEVVLLRTTWKKMAEKATEQQFSREAMILSLKVLAKQLGLNLTKRKALALIPLVGAPIGAAVNGSYIKDIGWAARRAYQERWLKDHGRWIEQEAK